MTKPKLNYPGTTRVLPRVPRLTRQLAPLTSRKRGLLALLGPGLITGASEDDPSGIATYSQAGAQFGYSMTWVMLFSFPHLGRGHATRKPARRAALVHSEDHPPPSFPADQDEGVSAGGAAPPPNVILSRSVDQVGRKSETTFGIAGHHFEIGAFQAPRPS
jgi:hypothetical protein